MAATLCGSPLYMAPEILLGRRYDSKVDLWSTGTILYQCLTGEAPFKAPNPYALRRKYLKESLIPRIPNGTSETLADLLFKLLKKNNQERLSHVTLLSHPFLQNTCTYKELSQDYSPPTFHAKSSPVPIQRQHQTTHSGYQHTSPVHHY
jgi:serine/threonine-protein kinase ULK/ATG1